MGFYLLHEGMLDSVLLARDKFLKEDGMLFPSTCKLYVAPCSLPSLYARWNEVNGVKMSSFGTALRTSYSGKPKIATIPPQNLLTSGKCFFEIELKNAATEDLDNISYRLFCSSDFDGLYQGICIWFAVGFPCLNKASPVGITFSTSPDEPKTHWKQTVLVMPREMEVEQGDPVFGVLNLRRSATNPRFYDIEFEIVNPESEEHPLDCDCSFTRCKIIRALSSQYDERDEEMYNVD